MPHAKVSDLLKMADENKFAVAAYDVFDFASADWVVKAAEREKLPVMLMFYPAMRSFIPLRTIAAILTETAKAAAVPVGVHLDHSNSYELAVEGAAAGFQSVMIDGSTLPFEENVKVSADVVRCAHLFGKDVEAELGKVGSAAKTEDFLDESGYTSVAEAKEFTERTGVDSLAIAIGSSHGNYVVEPKLSMTRLSEINSAIDTPLVLHGGSGIPAEQISEAVRNGINKMNIGTEFFAKCKEVLAKEMPGEGSVWDVYTRSAEPVIELVQSRMRVLNPNGFKLSGV